MLLLIAGLVAGCGSKDIKNIDNAVTKVSLLAGEKSLQNSRSENEIVLKSEKDTKVALSSKEEDKASSEVVDKDGQKEAAKDTLIEDAKVKDVQASSKKDEKSNNQDKIGSSDSGQNKKPDEVKQVQNSTAVQQSAPIPAAQAQVSVAVVQTVTPAETTNTTAQALPVVQPEVTQPISQPSVVVQDGQPEISLNSLSKGVVDIKYPRSFNEVVKVTIQKGGVRYTYNLISKSENETFPLQLGNGDYVVSVLRNVSGNSYKTVATWNVSLNINNSNAVYLNSIQLVRWNNSTNAVIKAKEITSGLGSDEDKIKAIYNYLISNMRYDNAKASNISSSYIPEINQVFNQKSGICYDFASTFAAMLRSLNIPTKLVMGDSTNVSGYHAWNEVFINGNWIIIDTSYDSQLKAANQGISMSKSSSQYAKSKEY